MLVSLDACFLHCIHMLISSYLNTWMRLACYCVFVSNILLKKAQGITFSVWGTRRSEPRSILLHTTDMICLHLELKAVTQSAECLTQGHTPSKGQTNSHLKHCSYNLFLKMTGSFKVTPVFKNLTQEMGLSLRWAWCYCRWEGRFLYESGFSRGAEMIQWACVCVLSMCVCVCACV